MLHFDEGLNWSKAGKVRTSQLADARPDTCRPNWVLAKGTSNPKSELCTSPYNTNTSISNSSPPSRRHHQHRTTAGRLFFLPSIAVNLFIRVVIIASTRARGAWKLPPIALLSDRESNFRNLISPILHPLPTPESNAASSST